ncbi:hypothetical protein OHA84_29940 [Streptomyces sp. NBC_00513]|uniref:hypothetical protein n=1 Tax=unclassified Streptomyces TaxID=2593676 RepID=UPI00224F1D1B|nr:hypothetical protein [Streptomyces sp. NBC_00424]MCX5072266.1 hypothetical protein [Streptomyces sp. NBC_00424]WUD44383.1 hypothetical protein OHA84_29940 [Streptomyces sp. NBC_00513]
MGPLAGTGSREQYRGSAQGDRGRRRAGDGETIQLYVVHSAAAAGINLGDGW